VSVSWHARIVAHAIERKSRNSLDRSGIDRFWVMRGSFPAGRHFQPRCRDCGGDNNPSQSPSGQGPHERSDRGGRKSRRARPGAALASCDYGVAGLRYLGSSAHSRLPPQAPSRRPGSWTSSTHDARSSGPRPRRLTRGKSLLLLRRNGDRPSDVLLQRGSSRDGGWGADRRANGRLLQAAFRWLPPCRCDPIASRDAPRPLCGAAPERSIGSAQSVDSG
jgi:hypothetical protein